MSDEYKIPQTLNEFVHLLKVVNLPVFPVNVLTQMGKDDGENIKRALVEVANNGPKKDYCKEYLANAMSAYSPGVAKVISALGYQLTEPSQLFSVLRQEGKAARAALRSLMQNPADQTTKGYILALLGPMGLPKIEDPVAPQHHEHAPSPAPANVTNLPSASAPPTGNDPHYTAADLEYGSAPPTEPQEKPDIQSAHIYGRRAAFCFTKDKTQTGGHPTVTIDAAPVKPNMEKSYDWKKKVIFQLTVGELALVYGVLTGRLQSLRLAGHGKTNNKTLTMEDQGGNYFFSVQVRDEGSIAIPALAKDTFRPMIMLWEQIQLNAPGVDPATLDKMVARVCAKYVDPQTRKAA